MGSTLLTQKAVVLAKIQTAVGSPATLSAALDAIQVADPVFGVDPTVLERNFTSKDLSPFPHLIGRKLASMSFTTEMRGNGLQQSGVLADQPRLARLLQACGFSVAAMSAAASCLGPIVPDAGNSAAVPAIAWATAGTLAVGHTKPVMYTITKGATNTITITNNDNTIDPGTGASTTIASGTAVVLGACGVTITPTFTGTIPTGSIFRVIVFPKGIKVLPISEDQLPITLEAYFDGIKHTITDAFGTFSVNAEAGGYATLEFTFTGNYVAPTGAALPDPTFETTLPQQVENAALTWGGATDLVVAAWTYDQQNTIVPRPDVNSPDGYKGSRITSRAPAGGMDPEAMLVAEGDFWGDFATAKSKLFQARVGSTPGNVVMMVGPVVQTSDVAYGDRDGLRTFDLSLLFKRLNGNDEIGFYFV